MASSFLPSQEAGLAGHRPQEDFGLGAALSFPRRCGSPGHSDISCIKHGVSHLPAFILCL